MLRYSLMRLVIFLACAGAIWVAGVRPAGWEDTGRLAWLIFGAAIVSAIVSYVALKKERDRFSERIARRVETRQQAAQARNDEEDRLLE